jgi:predicted metal-binding membrane protein
MDRRSALERVLARDRIPILAAIAGVTALAWAYLVLMADGMHGAMHGGMPDMPGMAHGTVPPSSWTAAHFGMMLGMWAVMMVGMMLPAAAPMILFFVTFAKRSREQGHRVAPVGAFVSGYLAVWSAFALLATTLQ